MIRKSILIIALICMPFFALRGLQEYRFTSVQTGSMSPDIIAGDMLMVKLFKPPQQIVTGSIIVFQRYDGSRFVTVAHRVVGRDGVGYITKGDANAQPDRQIVYVQQIIGVVAGKPLPYAGAVLDTVKTPYGLAGFVYLPALLVVMSEVQRLQQYYEVLRRSVYFRRYSSLL